jgi:hypothetical protein
MLSSWFLAAVYDASSVRYDRDVNETDGKEVNSPGNRA